MDDKLNAVQRYTAFTREPAGGNPAGIVLNAAEWSEEAMQRVASAVGYSETAFITGEVSGNPQIRYFSPVAEVPFCGHATIALAERDGPGDRVFITRSGPVPVRSSRDATDAYVATLTSVTPRVTEPEPRDLADAMDALGWAAADLHPDLPPRVSFAGATHLILVAANRERLRHLDYDYLQVKPLVDRAGWTTIHLAWPQQFPPLHTVRNVFPAGAVREDPATGAAAAAYGAYLRALGAITPPIRLELRQGEAMGRPSTLFVDVPVADAGIQVSGNAVPLPKGQENRAGA